MLDHFIIIGFGLFLLSGAYFGARAGSKISLIMGIVSGVSVFIGDMIVRYNKGAGILFLMILSGLLIVAFVQRFLKTKKMMPAGMLLIVSTAFFGYTLYQFLNI